MKNPTDAAKKPIRTTQYLTIRPINGDGKRKRFFRDPLYRMMIRMEDQLYKSTSIPAEFQGIRTMLEAINE